MKIKNKLHLLFLSILLIIPLNVFAYSNYVVVGGETIGIEVNSKGVMIVGFYKIDDKYIARDAGFAVGDIIVKVNNNSVYDISSMVNFISKSNGDVIFDVLRGKSQKKVKMVLKSDSDGVLKTGLYVKDKINGIGTLTYIDPETRIFGALGHEILESNTISKFEIKDGSIYSASVSGITKSRNGKAGEKNANYNKQNVNGTINSNEISGIYGEYIDNIANLETIEVGNPSDISLGEAYIKTVISGNDALLFKINILNIDLNSKTKNILFEVIDEKLLSATGGIVQGMSGSPIIQNNKIIGAVNYVIVNDTSKGYGIFITTMLEDGEK